MGNSTGVFLRMKPVIDWLLPVLGPTCSRMSSSCFPWTSDRTQTSVGNVASAGKTPVTWLLRFYIMSRTINNYLYMHSHVKYFTSDMIKSGSDTLFIHVFEISQENGEREKRSYMSFFFFFRLSLYASTVFIFVYILLKIYTGSTFFLDVFD